MFRVLVLFVLAVPFANAQEKPEPRYKGKPLAYWVERLEKAESFELQREAAKAIIAFEADAKPALPELVRMLHDRSDDFRLLAGDTLRELGAGQATVPHYVKMLQNPKLNEDYKRLVFRHLLDCGPDAKEALPVLVALLSDKNWWNSAARVLCHIGPEAKTALPDLKKAIDTHPHEAEWLEHLPLLGEATVPYLTDYLSKEPLKYQAIAALGQLGSLSKSAVPKLENMLKNEKEPFLRLHVAKSLWLIARHRDAIPTLITFLDTKVQPGWVGLIRVAAEVLANIGPDARAALPTLRALQGKIPRTFVENDREAEYSKQFVESIESGITEAIAKIEAAPKK